MKRNLIILALLIISTLVSAQQKRDVVYLKNGSIIKGTVVEYTAEKGIKIETGDGSIFAFRPEEIEKITKEETPVVLPQTGSTNTNKETAGTTEDIISKKESAKKKQGFQLYILPRVGLTAVGFDDTHVYDWDAFYYGGGIQAVFGLGRNFSMGLEAAYNHFYNVTYVWENYNGYDVYYYYNINALRFGMITKFNFSETFFIKPVPSLNLFIGDEGGVFFSMSGILGADIRISDSFFLPIELRTDLNLNNNSNFVFSLGMGLKFSF